MRSTHLTIRTFQTGSKFHRAFLQILSRNLSRRALCFDTALILHIPGFPDTKLISWAALLNNQPLGFYPTDVLINDAKRRSIQILPVDVNRSEARCTVESKGAVRLSLTCVKGLSLAKTQRVEAARRTGKFVSIKDFVRRTQLNCSVIERLVAAGACDGFNLPRLKFLW